VAETEPHRPNEASKSAYDEHECEFCGEVLPDPGLSFLKHLDDSETCKHLWLAYRPHVQKEAGGS
jgi:hypothetical protein